MTLTIAGDNLESANLTGLNAQPIVPLTTGEGSSGYVKTGDDIISPTASNVQYSVYKTGPRIPTSAKIKKVELYAKGIDSNSTAAAAFDVNVIFSDSTTDGTPVGKQSAIPTSALTGAVTTIAAYASPNQLFGAGIVPMANNGAYKVTDVTFAGIFTPAMSLEPLWKALGFATDPGGFFEFFFVETTASSTAAAGTLYLKVSYVE